MLNTELISKYN